MRVFLFLLFFQFLFWTKVDSLQAQPVETESLYKSEVDQLLTIRSISTLPFSDNLQGIYARPLESYIVDVLSKSHRFDYLPLNSVGPILSPEELESDPEKAAQIASSIEADAFLVAKITKGPSGVNIRLDLFLKKDHKLLLQEEIKDYQIFDIENLKSQTDSLLQKLLAKIPYEGRILSRDGNRVTINLGTQDGIQEGQTVSVVQIISATRHPKFNFLVSTEKEILGKIKLAKIDDTLSFGLILTEREKGAIQKEAKVSGIDFVTYSDVNPFSAGSSDGTDWGARPDSDVAFGKRPKEWVPAQPPTFGRIGAQLGIAMFNGSTQLSSETVEGSNKFSPNVALDGEMWITPNWTVMALIHQAIVPIDNPRSGSTPSEINQSLSRYELLGGYTLRMGPDIWSTTIHLLGGWSTATLTVDDSSPRAFTSTTFSGFKLGASGSLPVTADRRWRAGAKFFLHMMTNFKESPVTSGSKNDPSVHEFGVFGGYKLRENLMITGDLDFTLYSVSFSGTGSRGETATSTSQRFTRLLGGVSYFF